MSPLTRKVLSWILENPNPTPDQIEQAGKDILEELETFKDSYKISQILEIRAKIKEIAGENHPLLSHILIDQELLKKVKIDSQEKVWESIDNKTLISAPEQVSICEALLEKETLPFIILGLLLATGRRYNELKLENFKLSENPEEIIFQGQLKKRGETKPYSIPVLVRRSLVLKGLIKLGESKENISDKTFSHHVWTLSHHIFGHKIHDLRGKYCSLILAREGLLEKEALKEPFFRAKELLGHEKESNATFAYRKFAVTDEINEGCLKISLEKIQKGDIEPVAQGRSFGQNNIFKVLESFYDPTDLKMSWLEFQRVYRDTYKKKTGKTLWVQKLKEFWTIKQNELREAIK